ncbi:MAG: SAF domain-containing protein [Arthrobacter sp.]
MVNLLRRSRASSSRAGPRRIPASATRAGPPSRSLSGRGKLRRFLIRRRRLLAGLAIAAAAGITVQALLPAGSATTASVAVAHDLPAGHLLTPQDLLLVRLPPEAVPPGALTEAEAVAGEVLAVPMLGGTVVSQTVLAGDGMLAGAPAGTAAVPLRPADPATAALLSPGVRVDVVVVPEEGFDGAGAPEILAAGVPVLWVTGGGNSGGPWPGAAAGEAQEQLVVVAAPGADAPGLAVASVRGQVYLVPSSR